MTNEELIKELSKYPGDVEVVVTIVEPMEYKTDCVTLAISHISKGWLPSGVLSVEVDEVLLS